MCDYININQNDPNSVPLKLSMRIFHNCHILKAYLNKHVLLDFKFDFKRNKVQLNVMLVIFFDLKYYKYELSNTQNTFSH